MIEFAATNIWPRLKAAARACRQPADIAVAYFGRSGNKLLPLPRGSRLVVDAGEDAVKQGRTCPAALKRLVRRGVRIYSASNLHAKVFVFGRTAFIGSANASDHSANTLLEATAVTTDGRTVQAARDFVRGLCLQELGPEELDRRQKLYRPPRFGGGAAEAWDRAQWRHCSPRVATGPAGSPDPRVAAGRVRVGAREREEGCAEAAGETATASTAGLPLGRALPLQGR